MKENPQQPKIMGDGDNGTKRHQGFTCMQRAPIS